MRLAPVVAALVLLAACAGDPDEPVGPGPRQTVMPDVEQVEGTAAFGDPAALAFAANGDLWVGNYESSTLARYRADDLVVSGAPKAATVISGGAVKGPNAMVFDAHGYLWVAMYDGDRVAGFTPGDLAAGRPPSRVLPDPAHVLRKPAGVALDRDGNLWVSNSGVGHLVRYPRRGGLEAGTAKPDVVLDVANDECQGIAVQGDRLWLACADTDIVYVYSATARSGRAPWLTRLDIHDGCGPVQLVPDPLGDLVAACYRTPKVRVVAQGHGQFGERQVAAGQALTNVHGIAFDASGSLWAGTNYNVILRYPAGERFPDVILRPRPTDPIPTLTTTPVQDA